MDEILGIIRDALRYTMQEVVFDDFEPLDFLDKFVPMDNRRMPGVREIEYWRATRTGVYTRLGENANDVGTSDVHLRPVTYEAESFGAKIRYSSQEIDKIRFAQSNSQSRIAIDIAQEKLRADEQAWRELLNRVFANGVQGKRAFGLLNHPDVPRRIAPYAIGASQTPENNTAFLFSCVNAVGQISRGVHKPRQLILPETRFNELKQQRYSDDGSMTSLGYFLENNGPVEAIEGSYNLEGIGPNGGDLAILYTRSPDNLVGVVPKDRTQFGPVQYSNFEVQTFFDGAVSGVHWKKPLSGMIIELPRV